LRKWLGMVLESNDGRWLSQPLDHQVIPGAGGIWRYGVDWVIAGGESGPGARAVHPDWVRSIRDQCIEAPTAVPFFFKQWGEYLPHDQKGRLVSRRMRVLPIAKQRHAFEGDAYAAKVGKKNAGRTIDGRQWSEFPKQATMFGSSQQEQRA
jgi:protein gp37